MQLTKVDWLILALALFLRVWGLDWKPAHFDEGINGWFVDQMKAMGFYRYDPNHYHGPLHFYVLFVSDALGGRNLWALRLPVVMVSFLSVFWVLRYRDFFSRRASQIAALAMAISPAFVFYGRYSIHETWQVAFNLVLVWGFLGLWLRGEKRYLYATLVGIAGLILTKETYVIHLASLGLAFTVLRLWEQFLPSAPPQPWAIQRWTQSDAWRGIAWAVGVILFFYSGTFLNPSGIMGLGETFSEWFSQTVTEPKHSKPAYYWLELMAHYEWPAIVGLCVGVRYLLPARATLRFLCILGAGVMVAYTIIPYKTPWCLISILWPFYLVLGAAFDEVPKRWQSWAAGGLILLLAHSAYMSSQLNFLRFTDPKEPYVYVQTSKEISRLVDPLFEATRVNPAAYSMTGAILLESYYPLPWLLGEFTNVGYYGAEETDPHKPKKWPQVLDVDFVVVEKVNREEIRPRLVGDYVEREFELRDGMETCVAFFRRDQFPGLVPIKKASTP